MLRFSASDEDGWVQEGVHQRDNTLDVLEIKSERPDEDWLGRCRGRTVNISAEGC